MKKINRLTGILAFDFLLIGILFYFFRKNISIIEIIFFSVGILNLILFILYEIKLKKLKESGNAYYAKIVKIKPLRLIQNKGFFAFRLVLKYMNEDYEDINVESPIFLGARWNLNYIPSKNILNNKKNDPITSILYVDKTNTNKFAVELVQ